MFRKLLLYTIRLMTKKKTKTAKIFKKFFIKYFRLFKTYKKRITSYIRRVKRRKSKKRPFEIKRIRFRKFRFPERRKIVGIGIVIFIIASALWIFWGIPLPSKLANNNLQVSTKIYDRFGNPIYEIYQEQRRTPIKLDEAPGYVKEATISIEDKDFYKHSGYSITGMLRAAYKTVFKQKLEGGSTLTQQLVKSALLTPERTVRRKLREFALSMIVESLYSKDQILEMYLNQIPYGSTAYGIEAASELYFGKNAKDLDLAEASLLAGLTAAPTKYSPFGANPELAKDRQSIVLRRMVEDGYISDEDAKKASEEKLNFQTPKYDNAIHFSLWVKEQLAEKFGDAVVEKGGLRVTTTLDLDLQKFAEDAVATETAKLKNYHVGNGAAIVTRPKSGEILAMVGSKGYYAQDEDGKVNIIFSKRQPGSSIKPINYALALTTKKITLATPLVDVPTCFLTAGQPPYCPSNYDGGFHGSVQARFALANSYNIPAVRVLALNGIENFISFAKRMGITTFTDPKNYGLSLTLGGGEVLPHDMVEAFGVFANGGVKVPLTGILKVEDWNGKVLYEADTENPDEERVLDSETSFLISQTLLDNNARSAAFGTGSYLNVSTHPETSVKTGTTNDRRDNWTIGYTPQIAALAWVGNNDNSSMGAAVSGVSGASPIWNKIIKYALDKAEKGTYNKDDEGHAWVQKPDDVVGTMVCSITGKPPEDDPTCPTRYEYFLPDTIGIGSDAGRRDVFIDKTTGALANEDTPPENIETQNKYIIFDPLGTQYCLDCLAATSSAEVRYPIQ